MSIGTDGRGKTGAPILGVLAAVNGGTGVANGKTLTVSNNLTLAGTDGTTITFPSGGATFTGVAMTAGTMTVTNAGNNAVMVSRYDWTNAMVVALGAVTTGNIAVCTLPVKTAVLNAWIVIDTPDTSTNALTVSCGVTAAAYTDYVAANNAKAAANTIYSSAALTSFPSATGTTVVNAQFIKTTTNLNTVTGSTGHVYLVTQALP